MIVYICNRIRHIHKVCVQTEDCDRTMLRQIFELGDDLMVEFDRLTI